MKMEDPLPLETIHDLLDFIERGILGIIVVTDERLLNIVNNERKKGPVKFNDKVFSYRDLLFLKHLLISAISEFFILTYKNITVIIKNL